MRCLHLSPSKGNKCVKLEMEWDQGPVAYQISHVLYSQSDIELDICGGTELDLLEEAWLI